MAWKGSKVRSLQIGQGRGAERDLGVSIPSALMHDAGVVGRIPSRAAAPWRPQIFQPASASDARSHGFTGSPTAGDAARAADSLQFDERARAIAKGLARRDHSPLRAAIHPSLPGGVDPAALDTTLAAA